MALIGLLSRNGYDINAQSINITGTKEAISLTYGALLVSGGSWIAKSLTTGGPVNILSSIPSSSTSTGALVVGGGVGIYRNLNVRGRTHLIDTTDINDTINPCLQVDGGLTVNRQLKVTNNGNFMSNLNVSGNANITGNINVSGEADITGGITSDGDCVFHRLELTSQLPSTSTSIGALVIGGGIGIGNSLYAGKDGHFDGDVYCKNLHQSQNDDAFQAFLSVLNLAGGVLQLAAPSSTVTSTLITGALTVTGSLSKGSGSFLIPHPDPEKEGWQLRHCFVESNTRGDNIYRWRVNVTCGESEIFLPDYFKFLNENPMVFINPVNIYGCGYGVFTDKSIKIFADKDGQYDVLVIATRKDKIARDHFDEYGCEIPPKNE